MRRTTLFTFIEETILRVLARKRVVLVSALGAWGVLYLSYILNHDGPINPGGFYLESARQITTNGFLIPDYVRGFGEEGIPFVYPPLGLYVLGIVGYLLGSMHAAALYVPGILLPLQAVAAYFFMKRWTRSEQASQWASIIVLLMPQVFYRTLYGDGITTGLAGVFLFLSWYFAVTSASSDSLAVPAIGGLLVGLSILSHPGLGLFCAVSFAILYGSAVGLGRKAFAGLISAGITAFLAILPWLLIVTTVHGFDPFLAGLQDSKGPTSILGDQGAVLDFIVSEHTGNTYESIALLLFPFSISILYNVVKGPRVVILLLIASVLTFKGHPSVTMLVLAGSVGIFYSKILVPVFGRGGPEVEEQETGHDMRGRAWLFPMFAAANLAILFVLCYHFTVRPSFRRGEEAMYDWVSTNTDSDSTFVMEGYSENLVYFGRRTLLLPLLGAEWVPSPEYGNGLERNRFVKDEIYGCRTIECLSSTFTQYGVDPDYLIYEISDDDEKAWVDELNASPMFETAFSSESMTVLRRIER